MLSNMRSDENVVVCTSHATYADAAIAAKETAKFYLRDAMLVFNRAKNCWDVVIARSALVAYQEQERQKHESWFEKSCAPDPDYEEDGEAEVLRDMSFIDDLEFTTADELYDDHDGERDPARPKDPIVNHTGLNSGVDESNDA
jgi:hypothetical protein